MKKRKAENGENVLKRKPDVILHLNGDGDKEVKRRTGFETELDLLSMIVVLCNGDFERMKKTSSVLTWYEEFFFFFEMLYGKIQT